MYKNEQTLVIRLWVTDPDMIGAYINITPDGTQTLRGTLVPLEDVTRELYDGYERSVDEPVCYSRFRAAYEQSVAWHEGVPL